MASGASWGGIIGTGLGTLLGPAGSALGGVAGSFIGGLFDPAQPDVPAYQNYEDPRIAAIIQRLTRMKLGEQQANAAAARNTRNVNRQMEALGNDPRFSGNPITTAALRKDAMMGAEEANVNARIAGAGLDQQALQQAAALQGQNNQISMNRNMFEQGRYQLQQQPTGLDILAGNAVGYAVGDWMGGGNNQPKVETEQEKQLREAQQTMQSMQQQGYNTAPWRGDRNSPVFNTPLSSTAPQNDFFKNFQMPQAPQYQLPPLPAFNYSPYQGGSSGLLNYGWGQGRNGIRF